MKPVKPFKTLDEQVEILLSRGLIVKNKKVAKKYLSTINYYRLSAYTLTLRKNDKFYKNVKFEDILEIYYFDMELRHALMQLLESIEVSMRTHISYRHGEAYGPLGYKKSENFARKEYHDDFLKSCNMCIDKFAHNEIFIKHHNDVYGRKYPIWVLVETLTFGTLSKMFSNLKKNIQKEISRQYYKNIPVRYLKNWLHAATIIRNICAHQGRLFNRKVPYAILYSKKDRKIFNKNDIPVDIANKTLFGYLLNFKKLVPRDEIWEDFVEKFKDLVIKYPFVLLKHYGFPDNWEDFL